MDVMEVGTPKGNPSQSQTRTKKKQMTYIKALKEAKFRYGLWLVGMIIGLIPAMAVPIIKLLRGEIINIGDFIAAIFCQSEILFMTVSLSISSNNDAATYNEKSFSRWWGLIVVVFIVFGAMTFTIRAILEYFHIEVSHTIAMWFGVVLFLLTVIGGSVPYIIFIRKIECTLKGQDEAA